MYIERFKLVTHYFIKDNILFIKPKLINRNSVKIKTTLNIFLTSIKL